MSLPKPVEVDTDVVIAPRWHTGALILVMVSVAVTGALLSNGAVPAPLPTPSTQGGSRVVAVYVPLLFVQWGLLVYVCRVGRPRNVLLALLGRRWDSARRALTDVALAVLGWVLIEGTEIFFARLSETGRSSSVLRVLPIGTGERVAWIVVALSVGFCEEVVYRGYLQKQLKAFTGSGWIAVTLQALLFGMAHGEQGLGSATRLAFYGVALGALAAWRGGLLPGIICHIAVDLVSGFIGR